MKTYVKSYRSALAGQLFWGNNSTSFEEENNTSTVSENEPSSSESENANEAENKDNTDYEYDA